MIGKQYIGKLTPKLASEGIKIANDNAIELLKDAELLFDNDRIERSVSLSILAIEEAGKSRIIRTILLLDDQKQLKKEWQNYRKHTEKNLSWIMPSLYIGGARKLDDFRKQFESSESHGRDLDNIKQLSFYTDILSKGIWTTPKKAIDKKFAKLILEFAKILVENNEDEINSIKGLELWVKHLKPVWENQVMNELKIALINCYIEAEELGIIKKGKAKEMEKFVI